MTTLVLGASGATGKLLVKQLLEMEQSVKVIVRPSSNSVELWKDNPRVTIIKAVISELSIDELAMHIEDCQSIASCLGHNLTRKGIWGKPRKLVTDAVKLVCDAIIKNKPEKPVRFVLMNTTGNRNRDLKEKISLVERLIMAVIRVLIPPQADNEKAADYLRIQVAQKHPLIEWVAVRPDGLVDEDEVTPYEEYASPITSALFKPGKTSRINVGNFMARLIVEDELWIKWKGQMPVIYNKTNTK